MRNDAERETPRTLTKPCWFRVFPRSSRAFNLMETRKECTSNRVPLPWPEMLTHAFTKECLESVLNAVCILGVPLSHSPQLGSRLLGMTVVGADSTRNQYMKFGRIYLLPASLSWYIGTNENK
jgi:hypothetical protein